MRLRSDRKSVLIVLPLVSILLLSGISMAVYFTLHGRWMETLFAGVETQRKESLIQIVSVARNAVEPVLAQVRSRQLDPQSARERIRSLVRTMTYRDQYGENYVFMSSYDGTMLVQPFEPAKEMTRQWDLRDAHGRYIIRELVRAAQAHPSGSFVSYDYHLPGVHEDQEKLAYVIGLPELSCYIGTGMYMQRAIAEQRETLEAIRNSSLWLLLAVLIPAAVSLLFIWRRNGLLLAEIGIRQQAEEKYRSIFENAVEGIFQFSPEGRFLSVNPSMALMAGFDSPGEMIEGNGSIGDHFADPTDRESLHTALAERGSVTDFITMMKRRDGAPVWVSMNAHAVKNDAGSLLYFEGTLVDISEHQREEEERDRLRAQLQQAQKMESVGRLAGGVAHDFNNMLGVILGHAELALDRVVPSSPLHDDLEEIRAAAQRSAGLTRQLLAFARRQTVVPRILDLNDTIAGMLKMLGRLIGENIGLHWAPGKGLWPVKIDPAQLDQILANLCVNARDAIGDAGMITIETRNVVLDDAFADRAGSTLTGIVAGEYVLLAVSDTGSGMAAEILDHLFEPFFTTKPVGKGTGLGLATTYGIVKQNGGFIDAQSEPGKGTTFRIHLPRAAERTVEARASMADGLWRANGEVVLLVEDEASILAMARAMLQRLGCTVLTAPSPEEAIRIAEARAGEIRLLITDVIMPEMNGRELAERIRSGKPDLRCLFMSGYTADVIATQGILEAGVQFIQKPFSFKDLMEKLREALADAAAAPQPGRGDDG